MYSKNPTAKIAKYRDLGLFYRLDDFSRWHSLIIVETVEPEETVEFFLSALQTVIVWK